MQAAVEGGAEVGDQQGDGLGLFVQRAVGAGGGAFGLGAQRRFEEPGQGVAGEVQDVFEGAYGAQGLRAARASS